MNNIETNNTPLLQEGNNQENKGGESKGVAMNIFAILGFVAILLAGLWATTQLVKQISNFSLDFNKPSINLFGKNDKLTLINNGKIAVSGAVTELQWGLGKKAKESKDAQIILSYKCTKGVYIKIPSDTDENEYKVLPCNSPYSMSANTSVLPIIPVLTGIDIAELKYELRYVPKDDLKQKIQSVQGALQITKTGDEIPAPKESLPTKQEQAQNTPKSTPEVNTKKTSTTDKPTTYSRIVRTVVPVRTSNPLGLPDLTVSITNISTNNDTGLTTVKLDVTNQGTKLAENWTLSAVLPTDPAYTYTSTPQQVLYAGERAKMILTFNKTKTGLQDLKIAVDPNNAIVESLETNNEIELKFIN